MDLYRKVRLACREGMSERGAARHFGISHESVRKKLRFSVPPWYRCTAQVRRPKLDGFTELIDQWLKEDRRRRRKQRHTAKRVFDRRSAHRSQRASSSARAAPRAACATSCSTGDGRTASGPETGPARRGAGARLAQWRASCRTRSDTPRLAPWRRLPTPGAVRTRPTLRPHGAESLAWWRCEGCAKRRGRGKRAHVTARERAGRARRPMRR